MQARFGSEWRERSDCGPENEVCIPENIVMEIKATCILVLPKFGIQFGARVDFLPHPLPFRAL
ncbi:hypothetical protein C3L33_17911, partial [Rhododendron williamsianum]